MSILMFFTIVLGMLLASYSLYSAKRIRKRYYKDFMQNRRVHRNRN